MRRGAFYVSALPDKITICCGPLGASTSTTQVALAQRKRVVLHELAHHFGITDARLIAIDRY